MVKSCTSAYPIPSEFDAHFDTYPYPLSDFQKYSIEAIVGGHNVLCTAKTGSGKSLPAEFAIQHLVSKGKKVIYTAPIKALSNQKYHDFTTNPAFIAQGIRVGIFTGDIKMNPIADVLIMTTEILRNALLHPTAKKQWFELDVQRDLGAVVFDEFHFLNDPDRGVVWEQSIMALPKHVQIVALSATLGNPRAIAEWLESVNNNAVWHTSLDTRVVPLTVYSIMFATNVYEKRVKDKAMQATMKRSTGSLCVIQHANGTYNEATYVQNNNVRRELDKNHVFMHDKHVLNETLRNLRDDGKFPAICFVFSRRKVEELARSVTTNLLEDDSKIPYTIANDCEYIIRRLPNADEYLRSPEYLALLKLLERGVGYHHAGCISVLREMVELLYIQGKIKVLFATETMAIGVNFPAKCAIFPSVHKFDGKTARIMTPSECAQLFGRAGRRHIDSQGSVVLLPNLFREFPTSAEMRTMLSGVSQSITSKFVLHYEFVLGAMRTTPCTVDDIVHITEGSLCQREQRACIDTYSSEIAAPREFLYLASRNIGRDWFIIERDLRTAVNAKKRELLAQQAKLTAMHGLSQLTADARTYENEMTHNESMRIALENIESISSSSRRSIKAIIDSVFVPYSIVTVCDDGQYNADTQNARIMRHLHDVPGVLLTTCIDQIRVLSSVELAVVFSLFTDMMVPEDKRLMLVPNDAPNVVRKLAHVADELDVIEDVHNIHGGREKLVYDLIEPVRRWCCATTEGECRAVLCDIDWTGEFLKALTKIVNIASEFEHVAEELGDLDFLTKLKEIPDMLMKYIASNVSLYVSA